MITETGISLKTAVPGPRAAEIHARREKNVARGFASVLSTYFVEGKGALLKDVDENVFIDFTSGIGVTNVGHAPEAVVEAIQDQAGKFLHTCFMVSPYESVVELAEKLNAITPGDFPKKTYFANSGAEAVENAVKIARRYTERPGIVSLECAFHGRTLLAMTLTSKVKPYKYKFGPFAPEIYKTASPYCYRCSFGKKYGECALECLKHFEKMLITETPPDTLAAIIVEPVQGEGGFIVPPKEYLQGIKEIAGKNGILFIADEIQTGFGRTGEMFCITHSDVVPDLITMAKGMAAGMPLSAVTGRAEVMDAPDKGEIGGTYSGNPLSCAAGLKAIEMMEAPGFMERARELGQKTCDRFIAMQEKYSIIGDVRGRGAMMAMEFVKDRDTKEPLPVAPILAEAHQKGLILISSGIYSNCIRVLMPLVITDDQMEEGFAIMEEAIARVRV